MAQIIASIDFHTPHSPSIEGEKRKDQFELHSISYEGPQSSSDVVTAAPVILPSSTTIAGVPPPPPILPEILDAEPQRAPLKRRSAVLLIVHVFLVYFITSFSNGLITIGIPAISTDVRLEAGLLYWPVLIYTLTCTAFLLLAGALADVLGRRSLNLWSVFFLSVLNLTCGLAKTGQQLTAFRAIAGIALAFFLPTSVSLISTNVAKGKMRNIGFSLLGVGQVVGFATGLVMGGVFVSTVGWRVGYFIVAGMLMGLFFAGIWALPADTGVNHQYNVTAFVSLKRLWTTIDWVGVALTSSVLVMLAYVLAQISTATSNIRQSASIALLVVGVIQVPACVHWFHFQEKHGRPALIPNSLWKRLPFSAICIMVMFVYAEMQTMELLASLFFQEVQGLSAVQASIRILPSLIVGSIVEFFTGALVHRIPAVWLVLTASAISAGSPLLMALIQPSWPYWWAAFPAQILFPFGADVLFTVALLVISEVFPEKDQALAGAVFNVVGQFGQALGLAIISVVTNSVTQQKSDGVDSHTHTWALMEGYRAGFWTAFAWLFPVAIGAFGLRKVGKVGLKRD